MIKAVFCDIDGCLNTGKFTPLDLPTIEKIRTQIRRLGDHDCPFFLTRGPPPTIRRMHGTGFGCSYAATF